MTENQIRDFSDCRPKTEEDLVHVLQELYHRQQYYINAGDVLVSTNSWKNEETLEDEINSILTSFCNAKTLICNNSTRCLMFYEVCFDGNTDIVVGVNLQICLLEKFRVVSRFNNEGNFHIFHQFLDGLSPEQLNKYFLHGNHRYVQMNREACFENDEDNPLNKNIVYMRKLGFSQEEINCIFTLLSAIILLGDLEFGQSKKREVAVVVNVDVLQKVSILLGIPKSSLLLLIIVKDKKSRGLSAASSSVKAMIERDRLAVVLYETLVMWIESRINRKYSKSSRCSIFLLDAFGWENYNINFFEQLCINITNETLQCAYNNIIFSQFQMELEQENIFLNESYKDHDQPGSVPFLFKPKGFLDVLDMTATESNGKMTDDTLLKKMNATFKNDSCYLANNSGFTGFLIEHFIGKVSYDINGLFTKSLYWVNANILACLKGSKNKVLSLMVQERLSRENSLDRDASPRYTSVKTRSFHENQWLKTDVFLSCRKKNKNKLVAHKGSSPSSILTTTLTSVINRLSSSKVHFIRCIKSNNLMEPNNFDYERVLHQVRWSGLLATVQSRPGFLELKLAFSEFISRYKMIFFYLSRSIEPSSAIFSSVLSKSYDNSQLRIGKTKIFMSSSLMHELERKLQEILTQVIFIQKVFRGKRGRKQFNELKKLKNEYDKKRSTFYSELSSINTQFHDHLSLQIMEDERRLKNSRSVHEVFTDETSELSSWCRVILFQRIQQLAEFDINEPKIVIDGTNHTFIAHRIGFNSFPTPDKDKQMARVKSCIGGGVQLSQTEDGSLIALRLCKNPVFVKGHYAEEKLLETLGELERKKETKVFDFQRFVEGVSYECNPAIIDIDTKGRCLATCVLHICFVKNSDSDENCPCWAEIILTKAVDYVDKAISVALERRRQVQENFHFQKPPELRIDSKMESVSAKALRLIRPSRYIETLKFKRKAWARKRVQSNPFLYKTSSLSEPEGPGKMTRSQSASASVTVHRQRSIPYSGSPEKEILEESPQASTKEETPSKHDTVKEGNGEPTELEYCSSVISPEIPTANKYSRQVRATKHHPEHEGMNQFSPKESHPPSEQRRDSSGVSGVCIALSPTSSEDSEVTYLSPGMDDSNSGESAFNFDLMNGMIEARGASAEQLRGRGSIEMTSPSSEPIEPSYSSQQNLTSNTPPMQFHYDENSFHHTDQQHHALSPSPLGSSAEQRNRGRSSIAMTSPTSELSYSSRQDNPNLMSNTTPEEFHYDENSFHHTADHHRPVLYPSPGSPGEVFLQPAFHQQFSANSSSVDQYGDQQCTEPSSTGRSSHVSSQDNDGLTQYFRHQMSFQRL